MTLRKINEAEVHSTDGFIIRYGRDRLTYAEAERYLDVPVEHLGAPYEMAVYLDLATHWSSKGKPAGALNAIDRHTVSTRVADALSFLGRHYSIRQLGTP
jgi:hypothetical protein